MGICHDCKFSFVNEHGERPTLECRRYPPQSTGSTAHRSRYLLSKENRRCRYGYVDNSLSRVHAHTHSTTTPVLH